MCYKENTLSAFVDGELNPVVSGEIEAHLQVCKNCRSLVNSYRALGEVFGGDDDKFSAEVFTKSRRNVWQRLQLQVRREEKSVGLPFWQRRLLIPAPLAAGVLLFFSFAFFAVLMYPGKSLHDGPEVLISQQAGENSLNGESPFRMETSGGIESGTVPQATTQQLEELVRFLSVQGAAIELKIELPGSSHFEVIGEPQLIRASDYRREQDR